jgi:hypothetical protein
VVVGEALGKLAEVYAVDRGAYRAMEVNAFLLLS